jgi:hypothetical protein
MLRAKTPKVTFYSDKAKCLLMENDPDPDFEVCFYEGKQLYSKVYFLCKLTVCSLCEMLKRNEYQYTICLPTYFMDSCTILYLGSLVVWVWLNRTTILLDTWIKILQNFTITVLWIARLCRLVST